jgi:hypothetical protein
MERSSMPLWRKRRAQLMACLVLMTAACATTTDSGATDPDPRALACKALAPIGWSKLDTDETIHAVKIHNARWSAICGGSGQ